MPSHNITDPAQAKFIRLDWAIKRLLRNKASFVIVEGLISEILKEDILIETVLESESNRRTKDDKQNRVDVLVRNQKDELVLIEIQLTREWDYFQRMLYGTSRLILDYIKKGDEYSQIKKVYSINIVYFELGQGRDYVYHGTTRFTGIHYHDDELALNEKQKDFFKKDAVYELFPEYYIVKVNQFNDLAKDTLDQWIYFLKNAEIKSDFHAKGMDEAREELNIMKLKPKDRLNYEAYLNQLRDQASDALSQRIDMEFEFKKGKQEGIELGKQEGIELGKQEGLELGKQEGLELGKQEGLELGKFEEKRITARNLKSLGVAIPVIIQATGLTEDEINAI